MSNNKASFILRIAIAFSFLYVAQATWQDPDSWLGYSPLFIQNFLPENILSVLLVITHLIVGLWILSGWKIFWPSIIAFVFLLSVVLFNISQLDILFRDVSLSLGALALAFIHRGEQLKDSL